MGWSRPTTRSDNYILSGNNDPGGDGGTCPNEWSRIISYLNGRLKRIGLLQYDV